ncbi:hypothetical protein BC826DRAFT_1057236, partial [Russula brevipes]
NAGVGLDNVIAALEHPDRVRSITSSMFQVQNGKHRAAMHVPFPELTDLWLWWSYGSTSVLPDSFLGGSAPRLRTLSWRAFHFRHYRTTFVCQRPCHLHLGCPSFGPRILHLGFESPQSRPNQPSPPPQTRVVLPALTGLPLRA